MQEHLCKVQLDRIQHVLEQFVRAGEFRIGSLLCLIARRVELSR